MSGRDLDLVASSYAGSDLCNLEADEVAALVEFLGLFSLEELRGFFESPATAEAAKVGADKVRQMLLDAAN